MSRRKIRDDSDSDIEEQTPTLKRTRVDDNAEESDSAEVLSSDDSSDELAEETTEPLLVGDDGFVEGSIVKIVLTNFVTYDYCEISPGSQMNMIIGPNGTGKSTIVCAIALGLGGAPALLGRAKNIAEFVKTGQDEASISIELKNVNKPNVIIQRFLKRSNNTTSWKLNGRPSTQKDVMSIVNGFNIQVDNLCQFLPQDRVAEFAELSPTQLLERTQSATGKSDLHDMQKQLIDWRNQEKALMATHDSDVDHLKTLNNKNAELERDVLRLEKKRSLEKQIKLLKTQVPLIKYTESKARSEKLKNTCDTEKEKVEKARNDVAPIQNAVKQIEKDKVEANKMKNDRDRNYAQAVTAIKRQFDSINLLRRETESHKKEIKQFEDKIPQRLKEIAYAEKKIEKMENDLQSPPDADYSRFEEALTELNREAHEIQNNANSVQLKIKDESRTRHSLLTEIDNKQKELRELQNVFQVRRNKLGRDSPDTIKAYRWLTENKSQFRGRVYPPIILTMNLKDNRYAAFVESALGGSRSKILRTFIFEEKEDYLKFSRYTADTMNWKVSSSWPGEISDDVLRTPCSTEMLRSKFDMDFFVSDLIEAPNYILKTLCLENYINRYPVAIQSSREEGIVNSGIFGKFAIGRTLYNVKTSLYGNRSKQTTTTMVRNAEYLGDTIDKEAQSRLEEDIKTLQMNLQETEANLREYASENDGYKQKLQEIKHQKEDLSEQKRDIQRQIQRYNMTKSKLEQYKSDLVDMKKKPDEDKRAIELLKEKVQALNNKEEVVLEQYVTALSRINKSYEDRLIASINYFYMEEKFNAMRVFARNHSKDLDEAMRALDMAKREYKLAENETKKYMEECKYAGRGLPDELVDDYKAIVAQWKEGNLNMTLADLEQKIVEKEGEHAGITYANPNAMKHFEERKLEIQRLEAKIADNEVKLGELRARIQKLRDKWSPLVKQLVARIGQKFYAAFQRIGCAGEVKVEENEDFDKWGINIFVKFRDNEKLQLLTGQRQSGGERAVTTILYLMSLQDLARSPFRVVDEINQGMDPRNERMIHEQIVQGASRPGTSQYFLITPKLLPDLFYNERIRILCIYNGEWLPKKIEPLSTYLENYRQTQVN